MKLLLFFFLFLTFQLQSNETSFCSKHAVQYRDVAYSAIDSLCAATKAGLRAPPYWGISTWGWESDYFNTTQFAPQSSYIKSYTSFKERYDYLFWWCDESKKSGSDRERRERQIISLPKTRGVIHYSKSGCHIIPAKPNNF